MLCPRCHQEVSNKNKYNFFKENKTFFCDHCGAFLQEEEKKGALMVVIKMSSTMIGILIPIMLIDYLEIYQPSDIEKIIILMVTQGLFVNLIRYITDGLLDRYGLLNAEEVDVGNA